jgi:hypothetical protein
MPSNNKPVLSILVDGEKRDQFSGLCRRNGRPMAHAINQFIDRCLESGSINCSPNYLEGSLNTDRLPGTLKNSEHRPIGCGQERGEQDLLPEIEDFDGTADSEEEFYDPEKDFESSFMCEDIENLPPEPPIANNEPRVESARERYDREYAEHYGRPPQRR